MKTGVAPLPLSPVVQAALWMAGAIVAFTSLAIAGRAVMKELDTFEIMLFRSIVGLGIVLSGARILGSHRTITFRHLGLHTVRNLGHFTGQNMWFYALTVLPLAQVFALEFTAPLWVVMLAPFVLGERLTRDRILVVGIGFTGVMLVAQPWVAAPSAALFLAALAALGFAVSALSTRQLSRTESVTCVMFWLTMMQMVFGLICAGYDGQIALPSLAAVPWLLVIAVAGLLSHMFLTQALFRAPASVVMPFDFARLPVIVLVGIWLYGEAFDIFTVLGGLVIFGAGYLNVLTGMRRS